MIKLFVRLLKGEIFHFYDKPNRKLIKSDDSHYAAPEGRRVIHPFVAIFTEPTPKSSESIYSNKKGKSDGR